MPANKNTQANKPNIPMRDINFQVDTIPNADAGGYFTSWKNTVTINYKPDDTAWNNWSQSDNTLIHEQKHRDNAANGLYAYALSPEQAYKMNMHDEISANMASLLLLRQRYIENGDISIFEKEEGGRFSFYADAIKEGKINPNSPYQEDFDKEMSLIVNGTRKMWQNDFGEIYIDQSMSSAQFYSDKSGKYAEYYDENYQRGMKVAYNIGGVDFTKYMDGDVEISERERLGLEQLAVDADKKVSNQDLAKRYHIPAYDGSMSLEQYQKLVQHKLAMNMFMVENKDNMGIIGTNQTILNSKDFTEEEKKLSQYIMQKDQEKFQAAFNEVNQDLVNLAVDSAAREYVEQGKEFPKANETAYNKAVNDVYTVNTKFSMEDKNGKWVKHNGPINLRQSLGNEKMLNAQLPEYTNKFKNMSSWEMQMYNQMRSIGVKDYEALKKADQLGDKSKAKGWWECHVNLPAQKAWEKIKYSVVSRVDEDGFVENSIFEDEKPADDKEEKVKNKPIHEVNKKAPEYREWKNEDGSRVSEVQHRQLPDMTKDVIQKPTKRYAAAAQEVATPVEDNGIDKAKMTNIINYMNKINGEGKTIDAAAAVESLCEKYGDQAMKLLMTAVNAPSDYAKIAGDAAIKTSRAALQHLCALDGEQKKEMSTYAQQTAQRENGALEVTPQRAQAAQRKQSKPQQQTQTSTSTSINDVNTLSQQMKNGHSRVSEMREKLRQGHVEVNDNTRVFNQFAEVERLRFEQSTRKKTAAPAARQPITANMLKDRLTAYRQ
mgnify:FL=1